MRELAQDKKFCIKCGSELVSGAVFCSRCGAPVSTAGMPSPPAGYQAMPGVPGSRHEKQEKGEKHEKHEKQEKGREGGLTGPLVGGAVLILLGALVYLQNQGVITGQSLGGYFLIGIGILLLLAGLARWAGGRYPMTGFVIGGGILILLGLAALSQLANLWGPLILIFLGLLVVGAGVSARRRAPPP